MTRVCIAGITGWTGRAIAAGVAAADDLELRAGVARSAAGGEAAGAPVYATVEAALADVDVVIDYTSHDVAKANALTAIASGVAVVIGTSGLTAADFEEIDAAARERGVGAVAPHREIIDYASATKADVPSGTARELAERLGAAPLARALADTAGPIEARGATVGGVQVHSVRLPSFVVSTEVVFGLPDERLTIRHDAGGTPAPYVAGTLLAVRAVRERVGLTRGLDRLLLG
jgi:4-hydroxy-tetrahydrodipicolinate reductase